MQKVADSMADTVKSEQAKGRLMGGGLSKFLDNRKRKVVISESDDDEKATDKPTPDTK